MTQNNQLMKTNMKKITISTLAVLLLMATGTSVSYAWGRLGHSTIGEIAERHLTETAKKNIEHYTGGEKLAEFASWVDEVTGIEPYKTEYRGWHASIADENCCSPLYIRKDYRNCRDGVTAMEFFREYLSDYRKLKDSTVYEAIKCMVHIVGDFHCPQHVRYTDHHNEGKFPVTYKGKEYVFHAFWDSGLIQTASGLNWKQYSTYADRLDTWNKGQIRKVTKGWAREWFEDAARDIRPMAGVTKRGDNLGDDYIDKHIELAETQIRKAGYQLAAALNEIFGK